MILIFLLKKVASLLKITVPKLGSKLLKDIPVLEFDFRLPIHDVIHVFAHYLHQ